MIKLRLISTIMILVFFQSCEKDHYYRISRKDWTKLNVRDTIIYNSGLSKDTFVINGIEDFYITSDKLYHTEYLKIYYKKINISTNENTFFTYRVNNATRIAWNRLDSGKDLDTTLALYKNIIDKVWYVKNNYIYGDTLPKDTKKVYYSNIYGVIQYELYNGQKFIMDSTILNKYIK